LPFPENIDVKFGHMAINSASKSDFVEYSCHILTADDLLIKKNFTLKQSFRIDSPIILPTTIIVPHSSKKLHPNLKPKVRIIPIENDVREGGKVALECESG
jgi:hypothetical protein